MRVAFFRSDDALDRKPRKPRKLFRRYRVRKMCNPVFLTLRSRVGQPKGFRGFRGFRHAASPSPRKPAEISQSLRARPFFFLGAARPAPTMIAGTNQPPPASPRRQSQRDIRTATTLVMRRHIQRPAAGYVDVNTTLDVPLPPHRCFRRRSALAANAEPLIHTLRLGGSKRLKSLGTSTRLRVTGSKRVTWQAMFA